MRNELYVLFEFPVARDNVAVLFEALVFGGVAEVAGQLFPYIRIQYLERILEVVGLEKLYRPLLCPARDSVELLDEFAAAECALLSCGALGPDVVEKLAVGALGAEYKDAIGTSGN